jgi:hypothetical protein
MSSSDIAHQRLLNQRIAGEKFARPEAVVSWMGAMQGQDYGQAVWAVGLRTKSGTLADVERAIADAQIVLTWPMRGTLHFVAAEDAKWMVTTFAARRIAGDARRLKQLELDETIMGRCQELFHEALAGGKRLTRAGMMNLLEDASISPKGQRGYHILWRMAQEGLICLGPMEGKEQTFVLLDEWVKKPHELAREEALAELARRYFGSHGPATLQDFAGWVGITLTDARAGVEAVKGELRSEKYGSQEYWSGSEMPKTKKSDGVEGLYLLPGFDEYLLGYKDRDDVLAREHANQVVPGGNGIFKPMIVLDGQVVGVWKRTVKKKAVDLTLIPFTKWNVTEDQIAEAAKPYCEFMGLPIGSIELAAESFE